MAGTGMFSDITSFGMKRTAKQAVGFYIVYLIITLVIIEIIAIVGGIVYLAVNPSALATPPASAALDAGEVLGIIAVIVLDVLVLNGKKAKMDAISAVAAICAIVLSLVGGTLLGLIPIAYLTTR